MQTALSPIEAASASLHGRVAGLFGAQCAAAGEANAVFDRLSSGRRQATASYPSGREARTLLSGPFISTATQASSRGTLVSFVGHLTGSANGASAADTVQAAYARWGTGCFARLDGNYACAIYDPALPGLIIARDTAGTKPVFYAVGTTFVFGSSAREVHGAAGLASRANPVALRRYLASGTVDGADDTLLEGVRALPASHFLEVIEDRAPVLRRIEGPFSAVVPRVPGSFERSSAELRDVLLDTVAGQSRGGPVGVSVSGGTDSSGVLACVRKALGGDRILHAFTFVHDDPAIPEAWNDRPWAERMAKHVGAELHPVKLDAGAIPSALSRTLLVQDFPYGSPVVLAQAEIARAAADRGVEIMLSGHGPDVLFGAGNSHILARAAKLLRAKKIGAAWRVLSGAADDASASPGRLMLSAVAQAYPRIKPWKRSQATPWLRQSSLLESPVEDRPLFESDDAMDRVVIDQLYRSTLPTGVHIEECNAAAFGVENRYPYLVAPMLRLARALPVEYMISESGQTKHIFRTALRGLVPDPILDRGTRACFPVPALRWVQESKPWVTERLRELESLPFFAGPPPASIWERLQGSDAMAWVTAFNVWRWISLLEWMKANNVKAP